MINIIGAGLAGLSAAVSAAESGRECCLVSKQPSERAQSVLAEGGINAALDTMGENDTPQEHFEDTMRGGVYLADPNAVAGLTENAPDILDRLLELGAGFNMRDKDIVLRNFGGQKKKRTAYAKTGTGKIIMTALIDEARKYEHKGLIHRYPHHELVDLAVRDGKCSGAVIKDLYTDEKTALGGAVILASGGLNGFFDGLTTGTTQNDGAATVIAFLRGAKLANMEFIQYHPTTIGISGKRCLISEAARGEGGRLFVRRGGENWYFMEEKYPVLKNLMPRDVVSREMYMVVRQSNCEDQVYLDMTHLPETVWNGKLSDLRKECMHYLSLDPASEYIPAEPGIHYFMGGLWVDEHHKTSIDGLYAAGECAAQYHGANRLGGNSMLGALYGGKTAAANAAETSGEVFETPADIYLDPKRESDLKKALVFGLGIVRDEDKLNTALKHLREIEGYGGNARIAVGEAMLLSALERRESRGAHYRSDYPEPKDEFRKTTVAEYKKGGVKISFVDIPERRNI